MFDSIIAKEGQKNIILALVATIFFILVDLEFLTFISFVITLFLAYIYRNKYVNTKAIEENEIVAPISGYVSAIDMKDNKKHIYIDVGLLDSHILRSLEAGDFDILIKKGLNLFLSSFKSKVLNEQAKITYKNSHMELYSSICNTNIEIIKSKNLEKGEKIGLFLQGQVIVVLNNDFDTFVKIGDNVTSGKTLLAKI